MAFQEFRDVIDVPLVRDPDAVFWRLVSADLLPGEFGESRLIPSGRQGVIVSRHCRALLHAVLVPQPEPYKARIAVNVFDNGARFPRFSVNTDDIQSRFSPGSTKIVLSLICMEEKLHTKSQQRLRRGSYFFPHHMHCAEERQTCATKIP